MAGELLPTSALKVHVFVLGKGEQLESCIFNAVWLCFVLHGVPLKRSIFHFQWQSDDSKGKVVYDLLDSETIFSGEYNCPPPEAGKQAAKEFKSLVL